MANATIGSVIRTLREQRGLSQVELAEKARVGQSYLSRLESGSRGARADGHVHVLRAESEKPRRPATRV